MGVRPEIDAVRIETIPHHISRHLIDFTVPLFYAETVSSERRSHKLAGDHKHERLFEDIQDICGAVVLGKKDGRQSDSGESVPAECFVFLYRFFAMQHLVRNRFR